MGSRQPDQTEFIVLGISLIITAVCGYLGYLEYRELQNNKEKLSEDSDALEGQKEELNNLRTKLENVSSILGWENRHLRITRAGEAGDQEEANREQLQGYPTIDQLEENDRIIKHTRKIMEARGYSADEIEKTTANKSSARQFLRNFHRKNVRRSERSLTDQKALATELDYYHSLVPMFDHTPVSAGTLGDHRSDEKKWEFSDPTAGLAQGSITSSGTTVTQLLEELNRIRGELLTEVENLESEITETRQTYYSLISDYGDEAQIPSLISESRQELDSLQQQVQELRNNVQQNKKQLVNVKGESERKIYQKQQEKRELLDRQNRELIQKKKELAQVKKQLQQLRSFRQRADQSRKESVDGQVLSANQNASVAFINLGRKDGLFVGHTFEVFNTMKGEREIMKGEIEVVELFDEYARAKITAQENPVKNPIESNDYVRSEEFSPGQTKTFVFAGRFAGDYDENVLKQIVRENGHNVDSEVTINTTYLVIGDGYKNNDAFKKAKELNVNTISPGNLKHLFNKQ